MYQVETTVEIAGAHRLNLPYDSPCCQQHGHNWKVHVRISTFQLNEDGMVADFSIVKAIIRRLDHTDFNETLAQPTAENLARYIAEHLATEAAPNATVITVTVNETEGNSACYTK
jgi:6-pyruvoyltetrahydropterin/6-carboxytetrahydropterin synthase